MFIPYFFKTTHLITTIPHVCKSPKWSLPLPNFQVTHVFFPSPIRNILKYFKTYLFLLRCYNYRLELTASLTTLQFRKHMTAVIYFNLHDLCRSKCSFRCRRIPTRIPPFLASSNIHLFSYRSIGYCILMCMVRWRVGRLLNNIGRI